LKARGGERLFEEKRSRLPRRLQGFVGGIQIDGKQESWKEKEMREGSPNSRAKSPPIERGPEFLER